MGTTNEAEAETTEIGIATLAQIAAQSSVESHQSISPEKISKTNKTDLQWAEFLISKAYIKDICLTFNYSSGSSQK